MPEPAQATVSGWGGDAGEEYVKAFRKIVAGFREHEARAKARTVPDPFLSARSALFDASGNPIVGKWIGGREHKAISIHEFGTKLFSTPAPHTFAAPRPNTLTAIHMSHASEPERPVASSASRRMVQGYEWRGAASALYQRPEVEA